jgi:hypothetical protein
MQLLAVLLFIFDGISFLMAFYGCNDRNKLATSLC